MAGFTGICIKGASYCKRCHPVTNTLTSLLNREAVNRSRLPKNLHEYFSDDYITPGLLSEDEQGHEYILSIPYTTDEELVVRIIYEDIYADAQSIADLRHCFTEDGITSLDDPERSW